MLMLIGQNKLLVYRIINSDAKEEISRFLNSDDFRDNDESCNDEKNHKDESSIENIFDLLHLSVLSIKGILAHCFGNDDDHCGMKMTAILKDA